MAKFVYNNAKNRNIKHTPLELKYDFHLCVSFKRNKNSHFYYKTVNKLAVELHKLLAIYRKNFHHNEKV